MGDFSKMDIAELKIGYSEIKQFKKYFWSQDDRYLFGAYLSPDISAIDADTAGNVSTDMVQFGFRQRDGYGYNVGPFQLLGYNQFALDWTRVNTIRPAGISQDDIDILDRYENSYRFGHVYEGGLNFQVFKSVGFYASYEAAVIFPRHIFWEWMGSWLLQYSAFTTLTTWSDEIIMRSPLLGPAIYFLLKNGLAYAFYNAMTYNQNWPFTGEKPLTFETVKIGVSFTF